MSDWSDELQSDSEGECVRIRERMITVHASMDDWATDFIAALAAREEALRLFAEIDAANAGNTLDKPETA